MHRHLFPYCDLDGELIEQLKYDTLFDKPFLNDRLLININYEDHIKITGFINIIQLPMMWIFAFLKGDSKHGFYNIFQASTMYKDVFNQDFSCIVVLILLNIFYLLKPHIDFRLIRT